MTKRMDRLLFAAFIISCLYVMPACAGQWRGEDNALISDASQWQGGTIPVAPAWMDFTWNSGSYTVKFPAGGFTSANALNIYPAGNGASVNFDTTGSYWLEGTNTVGYSGGACIWFQYQSGSPIFRLFRQSEMTLALMRFSNGILSLTRESDRGEFYLRSGTLDFRNPDGYPVVNILGFGENQSCVSDIRFGAGSSLLADRVWFCGNHDGSAIRFEGGNHWMNDLLMCNVQASTYGVTKATSPDIWTNTLEITGDAKVTIGRCLRIGAEDWASNRVFDVNIHDGGTLNSTNEFSTGYGKSINVHGNGGNFYSYQPVIGRIAGVPVSIAFTNSVFQTYQFTYGIASGSTSVLEFVDCAVTNSGQYPALGNSYGAYAKMTFRGGRSFINYELDMARDVGSHGELFLESGSLYIPYPIVGERGTGKFIVNGGSYMNQLNGPFDVAYYPDAKGAATFNGGTNTMGSIVLARSGKEAEMTVNGGLVSCLHDVVMGVNPTNNETVSRLTMNGGAMKAGGSIVLSSAADTRKSFLALNGGRLTTGSVYGGGGARCKGGNGWTQLTAEGGTLSPIANSDTLIHDLDLAELGAKGLTLDSDFGVAVPQSFTNVSGESGLLIKQGLGTVTLTGKNWMDEARIANGFLCFMQDAPQTAVTVTNAGCLLLLASTHPVFKSLAYTSDQTRGSLQVSSNCYATFTDSIHLPSGGLVVFLSDSLPSGTNVILVCKGDATSEPWGSSQVVDLTDTTYTFVSEYDSVQNTTSFSLVVGEEREGTNVRTWQGTVSSGWQDAGNWAETLLPKFSSIVQFTSTTARAEALISGESEVGRLYFANKNFSLSGTGPLEFRAIGASINQGAGTEVSLAAPVESISALEMAIGSNASMTVSGGTRVENGALLKSGAGKLTLSGMVNLPIGAKTSGGTFALASDTANITALAITADTFQYSGSPTEFTFPVTISAVSNSAPVVFKVDSDLRLSGTLTRKGCIVKRGAGELTLNLPASTVLSSSYGDVGQFWKTANGQMLFDDYGVAPAHGYAGFSVAEGALRITSPDPALTHSMPTSVAIGSPTVSGTAMPTLIVDGCHVDAICHDGYHVMLGCDLQADSVLTNATLILTNGASMSVDLLKAGLDCAKVNNVGVDLDASTFLSTWATYFGNGDNGGGKVNFTARHGSKYFTPVFNVLGFYDFVALFDNSSLTGPLGTNGVSISSFSRNSFDITFQNGSLLRLSSLSCGTRKGRFTFDKATLGFDSSSDFIFNKSANWTCLVKDGGLTIHTLVGCTNRFLRPLVGPGGITKTGAGTLVFLPSMDKDGTLMSPSETLGTTGLTTVAEGTLLLAAGSVSSNTSVAVSSVACLDLNNEAVQLPRLSGNGSVTNGTLSFTAIEAKANSTDTSLNLKGLNLSNVIVKKTVDTAGVAQDNGLVDFDNCTFSTPVVVDLGLGTGNDLRNKGAIPVATYTGATPDVSTWKIRGTGHKTGAVGAFRASGGIITVSVRSTGLVIMLIGK